MDAYREYLELYEYFGRGGLTRLTKADFLTLDAEWNELRARLASLTEDERRRFAELKQVLLRDRP